MPTYAVPRVRRNARAFRARTAVARPPIPAEAIPCPLIKAGAPASFWTEIGRTPADYPGLTRERFVVGNLLPVMIGNVIGGAVLVGIVYRFVYLRGRHAVAGERGERGEGRET